MRTAASALHASRRICRRSTTMRPTTMRATNSYAGSGLPVLIPVAQQPCARQALDLPPPFAIQIQAESRLRCRCGTCEQTAVLAYAPLDSCLFTTAITTSDERYNWPVPWPERLDVSYASVPDDSASNKEKFEADTKYWKQLISELCRAYVDKAGCCLSIMLAWAEAISGAPGVQPLLCPQGGPLLRKVIWCHGFAPLLLFSCIDRGCLSCLQRSALVQCTIQRGSFIQALQLHNKGPDSYLFEKGRRSILTQPLQYSKHDWRLHDMCPISLDKPDIHKKVEQEELEKLARKAQLLPWVAWVGITMLLEKGADVNARNYCGQVTRADYLSGRTSLHFATHDGFVRCIRLLVADFVPSVALEDIASSVVDGGDCQTNSGSSPNSSSGQKFNESYVLSMNLILLFETITI
ncbi:hypothetical protein ZEAMMB73_Zm00001d033524 [Zea mays]|uniref:Uncharacterized protein n=1 Tax=Zea mays TaxID=4577 RepID=A0A1D6KZG0_MAIZE|nr:hypothetical protein ZEAMMB73_Zm00001d033524 [Zea mays]